MIGRRGFQPSSDSSNREEFDQLFVQRVHSLVKAGYDRLQTAKYASAQEPSITGDLASEIEDLLEYPTESWMRFFRVYDDPPVNEPRRSGIGKGRARKRVDIKLDSSESSPYTRFHFESKRLGRYHPVGKYLGDDGLGCFLSGRYAASETRAGMLGYVQRGDEPTWASRIEADITNGVDRFRVTADGNWECHPLIADLPHTYTTCHNREKQLGKIRIYHSLLRFQ